jgi:hypothetical protein
MPELDTATVVEALGLLTNLLLSIMSLSVKLKLMSKLEYRILDMMNRYLNEEIDFETFLGLLSPQELSSYMIFIIEAVNRGAEEVLLQPFIPDHSQHGEVRPIARMGGMARKPRRSEVH